MNLDVKKATTLAAKYADSIHGKLNNQIEEEWCDTYTAFLDGWVECLNSFESQLAEKK